MTVRHAAQLHLRRGAATDDHALVVGGEPSAVALTVVESPVLAAFRGKIGVRA